MENILEKIKIFADKAHGTQVRKYTGEPYIVHPLRVMEACRNYGQRNTVLAAALLHDVLEDTAVNSEDLGAFLQSVMSAADAQETLQFVTEMTDVYVKTDYRQWNRRKRKEKELERIAGTSLEAQTIKYADIIDNSDIAEQDAGFAPRYLKECMAILKKADKGNTALHQLALKTVWEKLHAVTGRY
jgi:(p)ppGpp synthase/HD superfamily hydrolase